MTTTVSQAPKLGPFENLGWTALSIAAAALLLAFVAEVAAAPCDPAAALAEAAAFAALEAEALADAADALAEPSAFVALNCACVAAACESMTACWICAFELFRKFPKTPPSACIPVASVRTIRRVIV